MYVPPITTILVGVFLAYMGHSMWLMVQLFTKLTCTGIPCYVSFLDRQPRMQLAVFTSVTPNPISSEVTKIYSSKNFDYWHIFEKDFTIDLPLKTRRNGTLYMKIVFALEGEPVEWKSIRRDGPTVIHSLSLTEHLVPRPGEVSLLGNEKVKSKDTSPKPVTHLKSKVCVTLLTDSISLSHQDVPPEIARLIHINRHNQILPILTTDFFHTKTKDLVYIAPNTEQFNLNFNFKPIGIGRLRLMQMIEHAMQTIQTMGFTKRDIDDVKNLFSDSNVYLICGTVFVASVHILFDFLSFKNDVTFWRKKRSYEGLSTRTTLWRAVSQFIIFLYLLDENTSMLVLGPVFLGVLIEMWKCKKILKLEFSITGLKKKSLSAGDEKTKELSEKRTEEFDKQGMRYLTYLLYPLCVIGAIYSLVYQPHRSWYSWILNSLVNGVYAFGFLFMLPQLFVNYKLKSVAALPWRAFMYKAFNTFIDDLFAFIISMPTAHRVACLRDDVVFLIYLYQRWLYPVDKRRLDTSTTIDESADAEIISDENNHKSKEKLN